MGAGKLKTEITDPLGDQKRQAADISLGDYKQIQSSLPALQGFFNQNFGNTSGSNVNPLLTAVSNAVLGDVTGQSGQSGPYSSLKQNLLGSYDTGEANTQQNLMQQLQAQGLLNSGPGLAVLGQHNNQSAQQRALLGSQMDTQLLDMANQLGMQQFNIGQQLGFSDPMQALEAYKSLSQAPTFQDIQSQTYNQPSGFSQFAPIIGAIGGGTIGAFAGGPAGAAQGAQMGQNIGTAAGGAGGQMVPLQQNYYQQPAQLGNVQQQPFSPGPANYYQPMSLPKRY